jgi:hypothetical protein
MRKHGHASIVNRSRLYSKWLGIKRRCLNKNEKSYPRYGGSGITISKEWMDFANFLRDMGPSFVEGMSIDRIENSKGYSKENCRWIPMSEQARNKKDVVLYEYIGIKYSIPELARLAGIQEGTMYRRLKIYGWPVTKAVEIKPKYGHKSTDY